MTRFATRDCECKDLVTGVGGKRPDPCECGNRYQTPAELAPPKPRKPLASTSPKRVSEGRRGGLKTGKGFAASPAQQEKVKGKVCVSCKRDFYEEGAEIQAAHVYPRRLAKCDCADGVVPLCARCHARYDDQNKPFSLMEALIGGEL